MKQGKSLVAIVHNVRSAHNVGSIFRTADGAGISKLYLTGYTPAPLDRFGRVVKDVAKTALGAELIIPWEKRASLSAVIKSLKAEGFLMCAIEQSPNSVSYSEYIVREPTALIVGNEVTGLSEKNLTLVDHVLEIPMLGKKESLNVSVAFGVVAFSLTSHPLNKKTH